MKNKEEFTPGIPRPYVEEKPKRLRDFLHGEELVDRQERNRRQRRKWALELFGEKGEKEIWDRDW